MAVSEETVEARLRFLSWLAALGAVVILMIVVLSVAVLVWLAVSVNNASHHVELTVANNRDVLCAVKVNADTQVKQTEAFLKAHPNGTPGIPEADLRAGLVRQRDFAAALRGLEC